MEEVREERWRGHLQASAALLPLLPLHLQLLHRQPQTRQLSHQRLVTHVKRIRDR